LPAPPRHCIVSSSKTSIYLLAESSPSVINHQAPFWERIDAVVFWRFTLLKVFLADATSGGIVAKSKSKKNSNLFGASSRTYRNLDNATLKQPGESRQDGPLNDRTNRFAKTNVVRLSCP
jgi:hypothetical protein